MNQPPANNTWVAQWSNIKKAHDYSPEQYTSSFIHIFYNLVSPQQMGNYRKPQAISDELWSQITAANPDPSRLVPVPVKGFEQLYHRLKNQENANKQHEKAIIDFSDRIDSIRSNQENNFHRQYDLCRSRHRDLSRKLVNIMRKIEVMRAGSAPLSLGEENTKARLEVLERELNKPNEGKAKLNEIMAEYYQRQEELGWSNGNGLGNGAGNGMDEEVLEKIGELLDSQQQGLAHLEEILKKDMKDLQIIISGLGI
eukprot:TRINITY_DN7029_c0_g1_i1.p1 TRINITY_DN7029_c0_g1~~TRINITY_DN7029_c0_g1_i1.p1  ORF type:complete len:255 (+),score=65.16 TRINITY_DN7029_c0_g1_i1:336-1100(+)